MVDVAATLAEMARRESAQTNTYEVTGGAGCPICTPLVGDRFTTDEVKAEISDGAFHRGCQHGIERVDDRRGTGRYNNTELEAVKAYQVSSAEINSLLRTGSMPSMMSDVGRRIDSLDSALRTAPRMTEARTLYRGVEGRMATKLENAALKGVPFKDKGFMSTTGSEKVANDFKQYAGARGRTVIVRVPAGTPALEIDRVALQFDCDEFLLPRGSRFAVSFAEDRHSLILDLLP